MLYLGTLFFLAIGLVCAAALWYDKQNAESLAIGRILQAVGLVCYVVGRLLSRERPARWMAKTGCVVVLFLPLAVLAGAAYNFCVYFAAEPGLIGQGPALYQNVSRLVQFWL